MRNPNKYSVYIKAHELAVQIESTYLQKRSRRASGISPQLRDAVSSVPSNIAEGCGHSSQREFARFLQHAVASAAEVENHLKLASDSGAMHTRQADAFRELNAEVQRMLASLLRKVRDDLTDDDDDDSVAAMQRRRQPHPPAGGATPLHAKTISSRNNSATRDRPMD